MGKQWKVYERRTARFFGVERTPLSGINSRHDTTSDTLHPTLYIECKSAAGPTGSNGYIWRWLKRLDWPGKHRLVREYVGGRYFYMVRSSSLLIPMTPIGGNRDMPPPAVKLMTDVRLAAAREHKAPLLALFGKGKRGFWIVGEAGAILQAKAERDKVCAS